MLRPNTGGVARTRKRGQRLYECSLDRSAYAAFQIVVGGAFKGGVRGELGLLRRVIALW